MAPPDNRPTMVSSTRLRRLWLAVGHIAIGLGAVGAFLPLLPTTPFLLLAAWAYTKSSPTLRARLRAHPRFGPALRAWQKEGAISPRGKAFAVTAMIASWGLATWTTASGLVPWILAGVFLAVGAFILTRPSPAS